MRKANYKPTEEKIISRQNEYLELGQNRGYFMLDSNKIKYSASGKKYNFSDPEEKVRAEYYFDLIEKYNYPTGRIELEIEMPDRTPERYADIVVYKDDEKKIPF